MDKIAQLLDIIEHPEKYSDGMLEKLFSDEQLSQYYEVMALASSAYNARRAEEHEPDDVDEAWKAFQLQNVVNTSHHQYQWWRGVAIFIGILVSGIAIAALWPFWHAAPKSETIETPQQIKTTPIDTTTPRNTVPSTESQHQPAAKSIVFDNATLEQIIHETADFYGLDYSFEREESKQLRLHVKWNQLQPVDSFVNRLNWFEKFNIVINDNTILIK